jgi:WD40 repeat protein
LAGLTLPPAATGQPAAKPLAKKDTIDEKALRAFIAQLGDDSFDKREAAQHRLTALGEPVLAALQRAATDNTDAEVRERAKQIVGSIAATLFVQVGRFDLPMHDGLPWASRVAITPDGKQLIVAGFGALRCWHLDSGKEGVVFEWPESRYSWALAFSPDGRQLMVGGEDNKVRLLDLKSGKLVRELTGHAGPIWGAAFSKDGKRAVSGAWDQSLRLWDLETGKELRAFANVGGNVRCLQVSPDGKLVAAGFAGGGKTTLGVWDLETGKTVHACKGTPAKSPA